MKHCSKCGASVNDNDMFCSNCGAPCNEPIQVSSSKSKSLDTCTKVFYFITMLALIGVAAFYLVYAFAILAGGEFTATNNNGAETDVDLRALALIPLTIACFLIAPLIYTIPMYIHMSRKMKRNQPIGIGFKVCTLIFVNLISGITILLRDEPNTY